MEMNLIFGLLIFGLLDVSLHKRIHFNKINYQLKLNALALYLSNINVVIRRCCMILFHSSQLTT